MRIHKTALAALIFTTFTLIAAAQTKPKLTLDEFFNSVDFTALELSPDGNSVVIATERADWDQQIFRSDLWLYRADVKDKPDNLIQLTQSGHDSEPKWSPDGRWIAFLSERKTSAEKSDDDSKDNSKHVSKRDSGKDDAKDDSTSQLYLISPNGGEAIPLTQGEEEIHSFSWSADSQTIYFATRQPWTKSQKDDYKKDWKDVVQYRTAERGDAIFSLDVAAALARHAAAPAKAESSGEKETEDLTPGAELIATTPLRVDSLITSPDGSKLAFISNAINQRQEKTEDVEIYVLNVARALLPATATSEKNASVKEKENATAEKPTPRRITHNNAVETQLRWASDSRHIFFSVEIGDVSGPYRDLQPHLYWVDTETGNVEQWAKDFAGELVSYVTHGDSVVLTARLGTEIHLYTAANPADMLHPIAGQSGTYERLSTGSHTGRIAFTYSSLAHPTEVYLADNYSASLDQSRSITQFNKLFAERDLPQGKPYQWKADDGTTIEGMLIYPPGKFEQKHLPMLTFIHGGPADADGNHFEADWYQWSALAATNGWLVFEPNYRGSTGYGDKFLQQIVPVMVSRPGKDILEGVDALVKDGIADPDHLTIGGYSYGGYMTDWLITQTTRFKAAVTGAGAVENVGNWGNDDTTVDDAYFLGGRPWEAAQRYHDEAAIFQVDKVRTPTHMVAGADDIRVAVLEDYLLEHALYSLGIPNKLLIFPGEGHSLAKNPWHGKIKVREELKWLQKYGGVPAGN
jgi:dipeptidyl aminopeptidase/acylaminoacyl peptidase